MGVRKAALEACFRVLANPELELPRPRGAGWKVTRSFWPRDSDVADDRRVDYLFGVEGVLLRCPWGSGRLRPDFGPWLLSSKLRQFNVSQSLSAATFEAGPVGTEVVPEDPLDMWVELAGTQIKARFRRAAQRSELLRVGGAARIREGRRYERFSAPRGCPRCAESARLFRKIRGGYLVCSSCGLSFQIARTTAAL